jgi:hypothetical protein
LEAKGEEIMLCPMKFGTKYRLDCVGNDEKQRKITVVNLNDCEKEKCAWWVKECIACSIKVLGDMYAITWESTKTHIKAMEEMETKNDK